MVKIVPIMSEQDNLTPQEEYELRVKRKKINLLLAQTDYTEEQAEERLNYYDYDLKKCIREYMGLPLDKVNERKTPTSINQRVYAEIRNFMDTSSMEYKKREEEKEQSKYNAWVQAMQQRAREGQEETKAKIDMIKEEPEEIDD